MDGRRDRHLSILDRVSRAPTREDGDCPARHCWGANPADGAATKRPGLLIEWRRALSGDGWKGLVVYAATSVRDLSPRRGVVPRDPAELSLTAHGSGPHHAVPGAAQDTPREPHRLAALARPDEQ